MIKTKYNNFLPLIKRSKRCFDLEKLEEKQKKLPKIKIKKRKIKKKKVKKDIFKLIPINKKK